jgi:hypothetical protein
MLFRLVPFARVDVKQMTNFNALLNHLEAPRAHDFRTEYSPVGFWLLMSRPFLSQPSKTHHSIIPNPDQEQ